MKKDFLLSLGIAEDIAVQIMTEQGKDIEREKGKYEAKIADYEDLKAQLKAAEDKISSFGDVEAIKADVEKYKAEAEKAKSDSLAKIAKMERQAQIKEYTGSKKFVNNPTRDFINSRLEEEMGKEGNEKKSLDDLFNTLTEGMDNIFLKDEKPKAPTVVNMTQPIKTDDDDKIRAIMGLGKRKE